MIEVRFEKNDKSYTRTLKLPDGSEFTEENVNVPVHLAYTRKWPWERELYEKSKEELTRSGEWVANALLGKEGIEFFSSGSFDPVHIFEKAEVSEIIGIPWEIASIDREFLSLSNTPIIRRLERVRTIKKLTIHKPLRMALISASPIDPDCVILEVEKELLTAAMIFNEPISSGSIIVDEIINCTREKLREVIRSQSYDIFYFTGHGFFDGHLGYLILEKHNAKKDCFSANDLVGLLRTQKKLSLVFLNCCHSAKVGDSWQGFGDVGRKLIKSGVPHVIATQSAIFDSTGRMVMKTFFENIVDDFNVSEALTSARNSVESDTNQFHDFYQFVHLSSVTPDTQTEFMKRKIEEGDYKGLSDRVTYVTPNRPEYKRENFVGRLFQISQIEDAWNSGAKVVGIHGIGGIGKTFLCNRMEEKILCHPVPAKRLNHCIWIDFRENQGDTLASFLHQFISIVHDMGFQQFASVVDDNKNFPTILEKFRTFSRFLDKQHDGKILLILDNLETVLNDKGEFKDSQLFEWFRELITRLPQNSKVLVTSRFRFPFYPDGRQITRNLWFHLPLMGNFEKMTLINTYPNLRNLEEEERFNLLKAIGGHPYIIYLMSQYYSQHQHIPTAVEKALSEGADYAQLDGFLSLLSKESLDWLVIAAIFPDPKIILYIINSKMIRDSLKDSQKLEISFREAYEELLALSLITLSGGNLIGIHPLVHYQLLKNTNSKYIQSSEIMVKTYHAIAQLFMSFYNQEKEKKSKVNVLIHAWDSILHCEDTEILNDYLQECASIFMGYVASSVISGMIHQVEDKLFEKGDEKSFYTIGFCAQTLNDMRNFDYSLKLFNRLKDDKRLPLDQKGMVLHTIGMVY
ncbi:MAG: CHAT domain-containing protein, partial [Candidatus Aminicenantes bacterium]|nr:CHAT domain-containing protein [Candidatus Aminicenantes bacterium]